MDVKKSNWYSIRDERLSGVIGIGDTQEEALVCYKKDMLKKKESLLKEIDNIKLIEEEINSMLECGLPFVTAN